MRRLRVLVLMHQALVPPPSLKGHTKKEIGEWRMEFDVLAALNRLGHEVIPLGVEDELGPVRRAIREHSPHIVFNLLMHFHDAGVYDSAVVGWLELMKVPYTGCNPRGLLLAGDKALSKKIMGHHRIRAPRFREYRMGRTVQRDPQKLEYPLIVKSQSEHASTGISQASIVRDLKGLTERVEFVHRNVGTGAIAEEFIEGRELTIGVLGNLRLTTMPVWEMTFGNLPAGAPTIATSRVKWDLEYQKQIQLKTHAARALPEGEAQSIARLAKRVYRALDLSGFARVDLRMDERGRVWVLEANPNPDLSAAEDFARSARATGLDYDALIQRLLSLGLAHDPPWKG
ncbi:MAG TPA: ATP-grasp domain-containing protein [Planctomycetes bacterium]|nr:ATP-grasp domain-containing protein [Planctomycetota bacterium]HIK61173.1 ATP-grasp domain-containing protein [Planctomycetota bacterium]